MAVIANKIIIGASAVSSVEYYTASVTTQVNSIGGNTISQHGHCWSTSSNPDINGSHSSLGQLFSATSYTSDITGLSIATKYYIRPYVQYQSEIIYGGQIEFTTLTLSSFEFIVSSDYLYIDTLIINRAWVIVYNADNEILIKQELQNGITYNFDTVDLPATAVNVQTITYTYYAEDYYSFNTYTNITPGTWKFGTETTTLNPIGAISLNMNDIDFLNYYNWELKSSYSYGFTNNGNIYEVDQYFNPDDVWLMVQNKGEAPYYKFFEDVTLNGSLSVSSSELEQMNDYVIITFPANISGYVYVESEDDLSTEFWDYYMISYYSWYDGQTAIKTYYPDNVFSGYYSYIRVSNDYVKEYMLKCRGAIPTEVEQLDATVSVTNGNINNFQANLNGSSDVCIHTWRDYSLNFFYSVNGPTESTFVYAAPPIPEDIRALNPALLDLSKLKYYYTSFFEYDLLNGYNDYIKAYMEDQRNLVQEGMTRLSKYIYAPDKKQTKIIDEKQEIERIKKNPYGF